MKTPRCDKQFILKDEIKYACFLSINGMSINRKKCKTWKRKSLYLISLPFLVTKCLIYTKKYFNLEDVEIKDGVTLLSLCYLLNTEIFKM